VKPKFNLWIEVDGEVAISIWRVELLKAIEETGSINAAADKLKIPYRTAWQKVHEMEQHLGVKLLVTATGGHHGGGAKLTPKAIDYLQKLEKLYEMLTPMVEAAFQRVFCQEEE
jgi:molybdate transport system regulatory protein